MKSIFKKLTGSVLLVLILIGVTQQKAKAQPGGYVSFQEFYDYLAPYGQWVNDPQYGYVWSPNVEQDFRPYYTDGYWAMTEYGNTWISNYQWGWACFHYGRWTYDDYYGWLWIPGSEWAPAWVAWRDGGSYYGWAPLAPGITIGSYFGDYYCPDDWWVFIPPRYIYQPRYYNYWRGPRYNHDIVRNTTIINNTYVNEVNNTTYFVGPRASEVRATTNRPVTIYHLASRTQPGVARVSNSVISMYRPMTVARTAPNGAHPAPQAAIRAAQPVGRPAAVEVNSGRPAPFKAGAPVRPQTAPQSTMEQRPMPAQRPQEEPQNFERPQPPMQHSQPAQQSYERPAPPPPAPRPQPAQQNFERPQPPMQRPQPAPQNFERPQPPAPRPQPAPQNFERPQPPMQRPQPAPQNFERPAPPRPQPMPQQHFAPPPMQAPRPAPAPAPQRSSNNNFRR